MARAFLDVPRSWWKKQQRSREADEDHLRAEAERHLLMIKQLLLSNPLSTDTTGFLYNNTSPPHLYPEKKLPPGPVFLGVPTVKTTSHP